MWKRDEAVRQPAVPTNDAAAAAAPAAATQATRQDLTSSQIGRDVVNIGKSVVIKGELNGSEDLTIEGHVEGKIELRDHVLTIGPNGKIKAQLFAKVGRGARRSHRQCDARPRRSTSARTDRSKATLRLRAWRSPKVRTSAAASTWPTRATTATATAGPRPAEVKPQPTPAPQPVAARKLRKWDSPVALGLPQQGSE